MGILGCIKLDSRFLISNVDIDFLHNIRPPYALWSRNGGDSTADVCNPPHSRRPEGLGILTVMHRKDFLLLALAITLGTAWLFPRLISGYATATQPRLSPEEQDALSRMQRVLGRDMIFPIYNPRFVPARESRMQDDELVLGIEIKDKAKAYPISILASREMVNDELSGVPILATW